jgi:hypothetical protein
LTVTSAGDVGQWSAMTILGNDDIAIAYLDATAHLLRIRDLSELLRAARRRR